MEGRIYISGLFKGPMSGRKRDAIKELVSAAIEVNDYMVAHPEVFRKFGKRGDVQADDGTTPYESLWRLKDAVASFRG